MAFDLYQNLFPLNIFGTNGQNFAKLYICIFIDKIYVGIVTCHFLLICNRVMALEFCFCSISLELGLFHI